MPKLYRPILASLLILALPVLAKGQTKTKQNDNQQPSLAELKIEGANVSNMDISADNGVIHTVESIIELPEDVGRIKNEIV